MTRWVWAKTVAATLACAGFAAGQSPTRVSVTPPVPTSPPEARDGPREGDVIVLRTAGQPERRVKVVRVTTPAGGEAVADLQDQATGARYTVPARMLTAKPRANAPPARPGPLANRTQWNATGSPTPRPKPLYAPAPATPQKPLYAAAAPRSPARVAPTPKPPAPAPVPKVAAASPPPAPKAEYPAHPAPVIPPVSALKALEAAPARPEKPAPQATGARSGRPAVSEQTPSASAEAAIPRQTARSVTASPIPMATTALPVARASDRESPHSLTASATPLPPARPLAPPPLLTPRPAVAVPAVQPVALLDPVPLHLAPPVPVASTDPMAEEIGPYLRDLFGALRPAVRERAASALAECRYCSRPEVKTQLAKAAADDASPDVRAHCVRMLSRLGYHESRYLDDLAGWAESGAPPVKQAAREALARMAVKN